MPDKESLVEETVDMKTKMSFSFIAAANWTLSNLAFSPITFYYNIKLGLSAQLLGIAWLIFAVWNAVNDPVIGILQ